MSYAMTQILIIADIMSFVLFAHHYIIMLNLTALLHTLHHGSQKSVMSSNIVVFTYGKVKCLQMDYYYMSWDACAPLFVCVHVCVYMLWHPRDLFHRLVASDSPSRAAPADNTWYNNGRFAFMS